MKKNDFPVADFLVVNLANEIQDGETIVQGTATFIPLVATMFAMKKKRINFIGGFWSNPLVNLKIPSTFCLENYHNGGDFMGLSGFLDLLQEGKIDLEFLRPAQVDKFGNMNNTLIGDYKNPKVRLPGGMGVEDVMRFLKRAILYIPNHNKKVFVEKVDFVTAAGWDKGKGPEKIITNMCVFEFPDGKITLTKINPSYSIEDVRQETGFEFKVSENPQNMVIPKEEDAKLIRYLDKRDLRKLEIKEERLEVLEKLTK